MSKDYYKVLDVPITASSDEIKKAYKKQALLYHPDKNHALNAEDKFKALGEAYQTLSNKTQREIYNLTYSYGGKHQTAPPDPGMKRPRYDMKASLERMLSNDFRAKFRQYFGTANPFDLIYDEDGNLREGNLFENLAEMSTTLSSDQIKTSKMGTGFEPRTSFIQTEKKPAKTNVPCGRAGSANKIYERYWHQPDYEFFGGNVREEIKPRAYFQKSTLGIDLSCPCQKCKTSYSYK